ncbi:hypothetical protein LEMLEM_LOCUS21906 [Lemmus lemmus]
MKNRPGAWFLNHGSHFSLVWPTCHKREPGQNFIELCTPKYDVPCETPPATRAQALYPSSPCNGSC